MNLKPSKKFILKTSFFFLFGVFIFSTYFFAKQSYNWACGFNNQTYGYFISKAKCNDLMEYWQDSVDHSIREQERVAANQAAAEEINQ